MIIVNISVGGGGSNHGVSGRGEGGNDRGQSHQMPVVGVEEAIVPNVTGGGGGGNNHFPYKHCS